MSRVALLMLPLLLALAVLRPSPPSVDLAAAAAKRGSGLSLYSDRRQQLETLRRANPRGLSPRHRARQAARLAEMPVVRSVKGPGAWEFLGPSDTGGRTRAMVIDATDPEIFYMAGVSGGVWKSEDGGQSWRPTMDAADNLNVVSLAMNPADPAELYAGTGEIVLSTDRPYSEFAGAGIYVTRDAAVSWRLLESTNRPDFRFVSDLATSVTDPDTLFAATGTGVWRSSDSGESWTRILDAANETGTALEVGCTDLELVEQPGVLRLLAACGGRRRNDRYHVDRLFDYACPTDCRGRLFRSDDPLGAAHFDLVLSEDAMGRIAVASAPSDPNVVYAVGGSLEPGFDRDGDGEGDYENQLHAVFRSTDGGRTFAATVRNGTASKYHSLLLSDSVNAHRTECEFADEKNLFRGQAWYDLAIAVDPTDSERVWVGGIDLYRSDDGGRSWGQASYWWVDRDGADSDAAARHVHSDQHGLVFHPAYGGSAVLGNSQTLYALTDGGLYVTFNAKAATARNPLSPCIPTDAQLRWTPLNDGYGVTQFYHGDVSADGQIYVGGTQDNGTLLGTDATTDRSWEHILGGDGAYVAIDRSRPDNLFVSAQGVAIHRSVDGGKTFEDISEEIVDSGLFIMPYTMDPIDPRTLYAAGRTLWRTTDAGDSWQRASASFGTDFDDTISALAVAPGNANRLYLGNRRGIFRVERARASGPTDRFPMSTPRQGWVSSIAVDRADAERLWVTYSTVGGSHVFLSTDGGRSWEDRDGAGTGRLPDLPVHTIVLDADDPQRLVLGTDRGVFVSSDAGYTWARAGGYPGVITEHLTTDDAADRRVYAFSHGRGVFRHPQASLAAPQDALQAPIDASASGLWFDPAAPGHGLVVHVIDTPDGSRPLTYWFAMSSGQPAWLLGLGEIDRALARTRLDLATGAGFPPGFDPQSVVLLPWGRTTFSRIDGNHADFAWNSGLPEFGSGSLALTRLAGIADVAEACISGAWYDPLAPGHGLLVQLVDGPDSPLLVVIWFAFVGDRQTWLIGTAPLVDGASRLSMERLAGTGFPPEHVAAEVVREAWGELALRFQPPDGLAIEWDSALPGFGSGAIDFARLTTLARHRCAAD